MDQLNKDKIKIK